MELQNQPECSKAEALISQKAELPTAAGQDRTTKRGLQDNATTGGR